MPDQVQTLLARLVSFDTTSKLPNRACIDFIRDYLDGLKIKSEIVPGEDGKASIWATIGPSEGRGIVLAGHSDTVPVEGQDWSSDPFKLTERDGKFFARGACDMKGFVACALAIATEFAGKSFKKPLHLAFTHDEETTMVGAARLTEFLKKRGTAPAWTWIGEPTSLRIVDAHKGVSAYRTSITGVPGHSGQPDRGLNAIELGATFLDIVLQTAAAKKAKPIPGSRFAPPFTTFNLATIAGGTAENIIAGHCDILWQVRAHPGDNLEAALDEIDQAARKEIGPRLKPFAPQAKMSTCTCFDIPPLTPPKDNPGREAIALETGQNEPDAVSFATEAGFFQKLGGPAVVCGPGSIDQAHKADEYVEASQLEGCMALLRKVLSPALLKD